MAGPLSTLPPAGASEEAVRIPADHPCLPGHFPGLPVVPGVVLIDRIVTACETWLGVPLRIDAMPQVKFVAPLLPGETARAVLIWNGVDTIQFKLARESQPLAAGTLKVRAANA